MSEVLRSDLTIGTSDDSGYPSAGLILPDVTIGDPEDASLDPFAGGTANDKPIWSPDQIAAYLNRTGGGWGPTGVHQPGSDTDYQTINFGFHTSQSELFNNGYVYAFNGGLYGLSEFFNFQPFSEAQKAATREAIQYWDDVIAVHFQEVSDPFQADITYGNLASAPNTQAYAYIPNLHLTSNATINAQIQPIGGDVWVSASQPSNFQFDEGLYGLNTLVHETGHALGLSHPGNYNFGPNFSATYTNGAEYAQDARNYSIMSYWNPRDLGSTSTGVPTRDFDWSLMAIAYGSTPMVHDILAAQRIYGADMTTRTDDTTYGFNSTAGRDAFDFTKTPWPTMAIWDAGGNDTLDASGYAVTQVIDLTPGSLSSIGGITLEQAQATLTFDQVNANRAAAGYAPISQAAYDANMAALVADPEWRGRLTDNVGIAYGTIIENAKGGSGKDTMIGNDANNILEGNAGNDLLVGGLGDDRLDGGTGTDTTSYAKAAGSVVVDLGAGTASGADGHDTLVSIENAVGSAFNDTLIGNSAANSLDGGAGTDTVSYANAGGGVTVDLSTGTATGAAGNDTLISIENVVGSAYADRIIGDAGANSIRAGNGIDVITLGGGNDTFVAELGTKVVTKAGSMSWDVITDFDASGDDLIDLSGLGSFNFNGTNANKNPFDLTFKVYDSVNGAEHALGIDIHDQPGATVGGPVTVVFGNIDGGSPDFAMVLLNTSGVDAGDFLLGPSSTALAASAVMVGPELDYLGHHSADYFMA